jgi:antitoxin component YwqK of YwqJK toxin-antitoxin module
LVIQDTNTELELVNGVLMYNDEPFDGVLESYYDSKTLKSKTYYLEGRKQGLEAIWHQNDSIFSKRFYNKGLKTGIHKAWWENGNPKFVYHFNDRGEYNGNVKEWYESGTLFRDFNYINSKEAGSQKLWYKTGKIKANYEVVDGERFGLIGLKKCYEVTVGSDEVTKTIR